MERYGKIADAFDALKKKERIQALVLVVEEDHSMKEASEMIGNSESSVRRHLNRLENVGVIENGDSYTYTEFGKRMKASLRLLSFEEQMDFLRRSEREIDDLKDDMKRRRKQMIKEKIKSIFS